MNHSPLLQSIIDREGLETVTHEDFEAQVVDRGYVALFFAGDAARLAESDDVAVVLPELYRAFQRAFTPLVVMSESERELQKRYRFNSFPSLVFLRDGEYLGVIQGVLDWTDYLDEIADILLRDPSDPPPFKFPEGCGAPQPQMSH